MSVSWKNVRAFDTLAPWIVPVVLVIAWEAAARSGLLSARLLPAPSAIAVAGWDALISGVLLHHVWISFQRALIGLAIGGGIGFALGVVTGAFPVAEKLIDSPVQMLRNVPHLAMIPLVILWFGLGEQSKVFLVALGVLFPIYANTFHGVRSVDPGLIEMGRLYGFGRRRLFLEVILPGALPSVLVGLRYALGIMWLSLIVAETIGASEGIGYLAMNAREFMQTDVVMFSILLYALLGKLADTFVRALERRALRWDARYLQPRAVTP